MKKIFSLLLVMGALFVFSAESPAQVGSDIAKRTLDSGIAFYRSGDYRQALQDFMTVINAHADSKWVDEALLQVSRYYYEVEGNLDQAREHLGRIMQEYATSNSTPEAYYYLGFILFDAGRSVEEMRDGLANLERVVRLFPESEMADDALYLASVVHVSLGEYSSALEKLRRLLLQFPDSDLSASSQFEIGNSFMFMDDIVQAMIEFQGVRNQYPDSELADKALKRLTLLYRLHFSSQAGLRPFNKDAGFTLTGYKLDDPTYMVITPDDRLLVADRGLNRVLAIITEEASVEIIRSSRPDMINVDPAGRVIALSNRMLFAEGARLAMIPSSATGETPEPLSDIMAFCIGPQGQYYVWDRRLQRIICFKSDMSVEKEFPSGVYQDIRDIAINSLGHFYVLDGKERQIVKYDPAGKRLLSIGPKFGGSELRDPRYLAVDGANNLYVLDRRQRSVYIFSPVGEPLVSVYYEDSVRDPRGLAVDSSGGIYIADRRENTVIRFK